MIKQKSTGWIVVGVLIVLISLLFLKTRGSSGISVQNDSVKWEATLSDCIDGDTARMIVNGQTEKVRFLAIDTPETDPGTRDGVEVYGKEASQATCNALRGANEIVLEFDSGSDERDDYDRVLAWIWVDDALLQAQLVKQGLAEVAYLYGNYYYTDALYDLQEQAQKDNIGIWSD